MKRHINIPWFVAHEGCGHSCVFCSQYKITGTNNKTLCPDEEKKRFFATVEESLATVGSETEAEIAFFGGSFTGIERERMLMLLDWAYSFVKSGQVSGIRISTRPDYIDPEKLDILKAYGVTAIELGVQSMSDEVLAVSKRGHVAADSERACALIKKYGFSLGCQMMLGLPGSDREKETATAKKIVSMGADTTRIYPILVLEGTELFRMRENGLYTPPELDELVSRGANCLRIFLDGGVKVLRMGLQSGEELFANTEFEPAYGEYVWNSLYLTSLENALRYARASLVGSTVTFCVPKGDISKAVGQNRRNTEYLKNEYRIYRIKFIQNDFLKAGEVRISDIQPSRLKEL